MPVPGIGVTLVAPRSLDQTANPEQGAFHLARLAERLF